jgi:hypothetical protein
MLTFAPNRHVDGAYNLWRGFACEPVQGDCSLFFEHIHSNICSGNDEHFHYVLNWMALAVQRPDSPGEVAIVLRGDKGSGKGIVARNFGALFGSHFLQVSDGKHLVGNFNAHLRDTIVLFADEAFWAGDKKHESILKALVTEPTIIIEGKGVDAEVARNYTHIIMASNDDWVVPSSEHERRFFMLDVSSARMQDTEYFNKIEEQMASGGQAALLHHLMNRDLSSFDVRKAPQTRALREQTQLSQEPYEAVMLDMLRSGVTPDLDYFKNEPNWVSVEGIVEAIADRGEASRNRKSLHTQIGFYLRKFVELDERGAAISRRIKRMCVMFGSRPTEPPDEYNGPLKEVRRTMYRLRPLKILRAEHRKLVDAWPLGPEGWRSEPEEPAEADIERYRRTLFGSGDRYQF